MKIKFSTSQIRRNFCSSSSLKRRYGQMSKKVEIMFEYFKSADYTQLMSLPGNPHPIKYAGQDVYAITVKHPFRCVFKIDGQTLTILGVVDYHGRKYSQLSFT